MVQLSNSPVSADSVKNMFSDESVKPTEAREISLPADVQVEQPQNLDDRAGNAWAQLRAQKNELRRIAEEQQKQLEAYKAKERQFEAQRKQLSEALKERDDELKAKNDRIGQLDLSQTPEFKKRYDVPLVQSRVNLDSCISKYILTSSKEDVDEARDMILGSDEQFMDYVSELPPEAQNELQVRRQAMFDQYAARSRALQEWQATSRGLTVSSADENAAAASLRRSQLADDAITFSTQRIPVQNRALVLNDPFFADDVKTVTETYKDFMQTATDEQIARSAYMGHLVPVMNRALATALDQLKEYQNAYYTMRGLTRPGAFAAPQQAPKPVVPVSATPPAQPKLTPAQQADAEASRLMASILTPS